jgi:1-acyl-sn-glycerol-3-phosphate acyltransferase
MLKEWFYHIGRAMMSLPIRIFIRKIHFDGTENFVKNKPVLIACNHPNSFLDGIVFEYFYNRKIYTLTRGDVFANPIVNHIFRSARLLPIFRSTDASAAAARAGNNKTFDECYGIFKKNQSILIFTEGIAKPEKDVRRLKKGTAAIAIDALKRSDYTMDINIVPAAINYQTFFTARRSIHVQFSKPIRMLDYIAEAKENEQQLTLDITNSLETSFHDEIVKTVGDHEEERNFAHDMMANDSFRPLAYKSKNLWKPSVAKFNAQESSFWQKVSAYKNAIESKGVSDANIANRSFDYLSMFIAIFTFAISFPVFIMAYLLWQITLKITEVKVKNAVFKDSFILGIGMVLILFLTIGVVSYFFATQQSFWPILYAIGALYGTVCWFNVLDDIPFLWKELKWLGLSEHDKSALTAQRQEIIKTLY